MSQFLNPQNGEFEKAIRKLCLEVHDGLKHGFFDFSLTCEIISGHKRRFTIKSGKSFQYVISEEELKRIPTTPEMGAS